VLPQAYQDLLEVVADAGRPLRAGEFAAAAGLSTDKTKVEGLRSKLRLLAARGWLAWIVMIACWYEDMILRFTTRPDLGIFTSNEAEQARRPPSPLPRVRLDSARPRTRWITPLRRHPPCHPAWLRLMLRFLPADRRERRVRRRAGDRWR
jgi:hypothetical protein